MEASAAGLSGGQGAGDAASQGQQQSAQQQQGGEQQQQAQSPDVVALLNGLGEQLNETREFLKGEPWRGPAPGGEGGEQQQQQTQEQEPGEIDLSFLENPQLTPEAAAKGLQ